MRYKITDTNVRIEHADDEVELIVKAAFRVLVPRVTSKLYFRSGQSSGYLQLRLLQDDHPQFRMVGAGEDERTLLKHFRIVESSEALYIAPNTAERLDRVLWTALCEEIRERSLDEAKV